MVVMVRNIIECFGGLVVKDLLIFRIVVVFVVLLMVLLKILFLLILKWMFRWF